MKLTKQADNIFTNLLKLTKQADNIFTNLLKGTGTTLVLVGEKSPTSPAFGTVVAGMPGLLGLIKEVGRKQLSCSTVYIYRTAAVDVCCVC